MRTPPRLVVCSSPQRVEELAMPPFRLLAGKGGSRSRRRSTLFAMQGGKEEPRSPKVTCIGQVRVSRDAGLVAPPHSGVRRSTDERCSPRKPEDPPAVSAAHRRSRCSAVMHWISALLPGRGKERSADSEEKREEETGGRPEPVVAVVSDQPAAGEKDTAAPKNALLLMRCRSVTFPASRVAEDGGKKAEEKVGGDGSPHGVEEMGDSCGDEGDAVVPSRLSRSLSSRPLILTRCRSEPRREATGGRASGGRCGRTPARTSLSSAAEALPFGLLQSTFRL